MVISNILVPIDGSKNSFRALEEAISLAEKNKSSITGLFVIKESPSEFSVISAILKKGLYKQHENFSKKAKELCAKKGIDFLDVVEFGKEGSRIVSYATKNKFDLIVMGSRGMGSLKEFFLGSTSNFVVHESKVPVLIVK